MRYRVANPLVPEVTTEPRGRIASTVQRYRVLAFREEAGTDSVVSLVEPLKARTPASVVTVTR